VNSNAGARVIHLVPPNGGGVDRCVRDLCAHRPADWLLHVSDDQVVIEAPQHRMMTPVAADTLANLVEAGALGRAAALHAHSTVPAVRGATAMLAKAMDLRYVVTLHDVEFAGGPGTSDAGEREQRIAFIRGAAGCTVPSGFMLDRVREVMGQSFACTVVENGVDRLTPAAAALPAQRFPVAVIGAMGRHKGLDQLIDVATRLPADEGVVLLGYADGQLAPGWLADGRIRVHGAFEPQQLPQLVAHYASVLCFFPKGQPESYCYALSDAWLAGLPVLAPDSGAIGERVRAHGGGTLYPPDAPPEEVALALSRALREPPASVDRAVQSLTSISSMADSMNNIYSGVAAPESPPDPDALRRSAADHLDSRFFRRELLRMQGDLVAATEQRDNALTELNSLGDNFRKRGDWIEQLQRTVDSLQQECRNLQQSVEPLRQEVDSLRPLPAALEALRADHAALQESYGTLLARYERVLRPFKWPLRLLPEAARARVIEAARRIFIEGRHG
jgi:glycosyltransferase involved in cell wall biosynthesis/FtsZ-binding cell division protein ZapB